MCKDYDLRNILCLLQALGDQFNQVLWVTSSDYEKQLYINKKVEEIWSRSTESFYEHSDTWYQSLFDDDKKRSSIEVLDRLSPNIDHKNKDMYFRVVKPNGELAWIRDTCFELYSKYGKPLAIVGIAEQLSSAQWMMAYANKQKIISDSQHSVNRLLDSLKNFTTTTTSPVTSNQKIDATSIAKKPTRRRQKIIIDLNGVTCALTLREGHCLYYLLQGKTSKEIAQHMGVSFRTVETYIASILLKTGIKRKIQLTSEITYEQFYKKYQLNKLIGE